MDSRTKTKAQPNPKSALVIVLALLLLALLIGALVKQFIGTLPLELISRIFGLILIAISVQFMVERLRQVFPGWT
ncbi:MarC family protein [uncultured Desulfuromusa sp.]|uniref:MarC family protein n=1 Tax=uncultured Desulfuromusa sp. TaxID=219183 RepID=UPI002AA86D87|nr:MarC family protein [uncultured Desulfuromusa sp.]